VAIQSGAYAAHVIAARADGRPVPAPFHYRDRGSMATISRFSALASVGRLRFSGFIAWLMWLFNHLQYLIGFKQRVTKLLHWAISFIGRGRAERVVTRQQVVARRALDTLPPTESGRPDRRTLPRR
jgi:NADH dehydrogenase